jgi:hypothetical protein
MTRVLHRYLQLRFKSIFRLCKEAKALSPSKIEHDCEAIYESSILQSIRGKASHDPMYIPTRFIKQ